MRIVGRRIVHNYGWSLSATERPEAVDKMEAAFSLVQVSRPAFPFFRKFLLNLFLPKSLHRLGIQMGIGQNDAGAGLQLLQRISVTTSLHPALFGLIDGSQHRC